MRLSTAWSTRAAPQQVQSGDVVVVRRDGDRTLFGVVDALGHGPDAHDVAQAAFRWLMQTPLDVTMELLLGGLHGALHGTRGAAATLCLHHQDTLQAGGVGNVELRSAPHNLPVIPSPGILGTRLRNVRAWRGTVLAGTRLVIFSDGISRRLDVQATRSLGVAQASEHILKEGANAHDDATVLVVDLEAT